MNSKKLVIRYSENAKITKLVEVDVLDENNNIPMTTIDLRLFKEFRCLQILQDEVLIEISKNLLEHLYQFLKENWVEVKIEQNKMKQN